MPRGFYVRTKDNVRQKGYKFSEEARKNISKANARRGKTVIFSEEHRKKLSLANKGKIPWIKGKKQTKDHIEKRVLSRTKNGTSPKTTAPRGEDHYLFIKDRTLLKDDHRDRGGQLHKEWSKKVKNRDGWKCRISNDECSGKLEAHHILSWTAHPELRYEVNNGITLCHLHHPRKRNDEIRLSTHFSNLITKAN